MKKSTSVLSIVIVNTFLLITNASSQNSQGSSNWANPARNNPNYNFQQRSPQVSNFGNGQYKHNVINVDENSATVSVQGRSYGTNRYGEPSVHDLNVNMNRPPGTPHITNLGNGEGNRNVFVLNDNRGFQDNRRRIQSRFPPGDNNFREQGNQLDDLLLNANIGTGYNNDNRLYINGKRIDLQPNNAGQDINIRRDPNNHENGIENKYAFRNNNAGFNRQNNRRNENTADNFHADAGVANNQDEIRSIIHDSTKYANNYGNGADNKNIIKIETVQPTNRQNNYQKGYVAGEGINNFDSIFNDKSLKVVPLNQNI